LNLNKPGIDCDDLFTTLKHNLKIEITIDEVFIIFYKVDKDSDGFWSYEELSAAFVPRE
jgi:Ca2+-binding EF-hand superfamily protein